MPLFARFDGLNAGWAAAVLDLCQVDDQPFHRAGLTVVGLAGLIDDDADSLLERAHLLRQIAKTISDAAAAEMLEQTAADLLARAAALRARATKPPTGET